MTVAVVSDLEGRWDRLASSCDDHPAVSLDGDDLALAPGARFVYGGDVFDRGPAGRRLARALIRAKDRYGDRVTLLAGNRDINKIRLARELGAHPPPGAPAGPLPDRLRWIYRHTMGAADAFDHRAAELAADGAPHDDDAVVRSVLADLEAGGVVAEYLARAQLAARWADVLFVHGGVPDGALGHTPAGPVDGVGRWIDALNAWFTAQYRCFRDDPLGGERPSWWPLVAYQMPALPSRTHPHSVVYGRNTGTGNNPALPSRAVRDALRREGVHRLVVGHTPNGDLPSVLRGADGFTLVVADASYPRAATCPRLWITEGATQARGEAVLDDGTAGDVAIDCPADPSVGRWTGSGHLCKGQLADGRWLGFRFADGYRYEQIALAPRVTDLAPAG